MKGLIIKDFLSLKKMGKNYLFIFAMFVFLAVVNKSPSFLIATFSILCFMLPVTTYSLDETCKWNKYALTMPISRKELVLSKYLFFIILGIIIWTLSLIICLFIKQSAFKEIIYTLCITTLIGMIYVSIFYPLFMKFGIGKARILIFAFMFIPFFLIGFITPKSQSLYGFLNNIEHLIYFAPLVGLAIMIISYFISLLIIKNKEF